MTDEQILEVILKNRTRLIAFMRSIVCDFHVAEDLYQKLCLQVLQSDHTFDDATHLLRWVWVVSRNESLKYLRSRKNQPILFDEHLLEMIQAESSKASLMDDPEIYAILERCLSKLTPKSQQLLENRYKHNLTGQRLADTLQRNVNSVYVAISRAHRALYQCMHKQLRILRG